MKLAAGVPMMVLALAGAAHAQAPEPAPPPPPPPTLAVVEASPPPSHRVSMTMSPIHLIFPMVEVNGEVMVAPHIGAGLILAAGRISNETKTLTATAYEVGGQFNYYIMSAFKGLHLGAEVLYLKLGEVDQDSTVTGAGLSVGPYAGFKVLTSFGFTFVAQLGVAYLAVKAETTTQMAEGKKYYPLLNLNLGWSF